MSYYKDRAPRRRRNDRVRARPARNPSPSSSLDDIPTTAWTGSGLLVELPDANVSEGDRKCGSKSCIRYSAVFSDEHGRHVRRTESDRPMRELAEVSRNASVVFEIVSEYTCCGKLPERFAASEYGGSEAVAVEDVKPETVQVTSLQGRHRLDLHSPALIHALRKVVRYWPHLDLSQDVTKIYEPFSVLIHHWKELENYRLSCASLDSDESGKVCMKQADAYEHLVLLKDHLEETTMPGVLEERKLHEQGYATFHFLWLLYKPGSSVIVNVKDHASQLLAPHYRGFVVERLRRNYPTPSRPLAKNEWEVRLWSLAFDGSRIGREAYTHHIGAFEGEIEVTGLDIVPADWPGHSFGGAPMAQVVRDNGHKASELLAPTCLQHTGKSMTFPFDDVDGLVVIDTKTFFTDHPEERPEFSPSPPQGRNIGVTDCHCSICKERNAKAQVELKISPIQEPDFATYYDISMENLKLTDHQKFLFPPQVFAFHFRSRDWRLVDVSNLKPAQFHPAILDTLVMKTERINMIKALSKKYMRSADDKASTSRDFWSADFIEGKGKSQIILLHGKPGVGKTYTAECIAEHTKRPLMTLTCADIGTDPEDVEENLTHHFTAAKRWGALVLIDEADVYMERRSTNDLRRNSLVASFLRALEMFEGMLFLTTNRVGAFDDAFVSRIHVKLYYPALKDDDRQKIWQAFINKLTRERRKDIRVTMGAKEFIRGPAVKALNLNGREIRNAFQTAVALAEYEQIRDEEGAICIEEQHVRQVAEMTREFQEYLDALHLGDEDKRAKRAFERHD